MKFNQTIFSKTHRSSLYAKVINHDGILELTGLGYWYSYLREPFHLMLTIPWSGFALVVSIVYIVINAAFALLYLACGDCLAGASHWQDKLIVRFVAKDGMALRKMLIPVISLLRNGESLPKVWTT